MAALGENDTSLASKCLDLCQALERQGKDFKLSLTIGNAFSFSMGSRGGTNPVPISRRKRSSPSTAKRNARRRKEFLAKKNLSASGENQADLETNQQTLEKTTFKCDQCDAVFKTRNGLKIHIGKSHKEALNSLEKLRDTSPELFLNVSPTRDCSRVEPCPNCGGDMSPTHLCQDDDQADEPKVEDKDGKGTCTCDCELPICCNCQHEQECKCCDENPDSGVCSCEGYQVHH